MYLIKYLFFSLLLLSWAIFTPGCGSHSEAENHDHAHEAEVGHADEILLKSEVLAEVGVEIHPVTKREFSPEKEFPGTVVPRPDGESHVGSLVAGRVVAIPVGLGDRVSPGQPLCQIESPEVGAAQASYIRARAEADLAANELARQRQLHAEKIGAEKTLLEKEAVAQAAAAELVAAERTLYSIGFSRNEVAGLLENHATSGILTLKSPINGTITDWAIRLGQRVEPENDLFHIIDLSRLWIKISVYENDLATVQCQQTVEITPQSAPGQIFSGKIVRMNREVNQETRTVSAFIEVDNTGRSLIPFMFVNAKVRLCAQSEQVLAVPDDALSTDAHGDQTVFLEHEPEQFALREVETGRRCGGWTEILGGLEAGERVVFKGAFFIKSEMAKGSFGHGHNH